MLYTDQDPASCGSGTQFHTAFDNAGLTWATHSSAQCLKSSLLLTLPSMLLWIEPLAEMFLDPCCNLSHAVSQSSARKQHFVSLNLGQSVSTHILRWVARTQANPDTWFHTTQDCDSGSQDPGLGRSTSVKGA